MSIKLEEKDREKVVSEISDCQSRIVQVLVPTVIAVGLISIADRDKFALITLITSFAILFSSSLYIASLSYKIFRNASFLRVVSELEDKEKTSLHWERALSMFGKLIKPPFIIGYETKTISVIFIVFSISFVFMFFEMNSILSVVLGSILLIVGLSIFFIPFYSEKYYESWKKVIQTYND